MRMSVVGVPARLVAITAAEPRRKAKGSARIRPRIGSSSWNPAFALFDQNSDRIGPVGRWSPLRMRTVRHFAAECCPGMPAVGGTAGRHGHLSTRQIRTHNVTVLRDDYRPIGCGVEVVE